MICQKNLPAHTHHHLMINQENHQLLHPNLVLCHLLIQPVQEQGFLPIHSRFFLPVLSYLTAITLLEESAVVIKLASGKAFAQTLTLVKPEFFPKI